MAILKFRVYFEEDDSVYRDVAVRHTQSFLQLHQVILRAYEFDSKHQATFYRSNDNWQRGREISLEKYDKAYKVEPLLMDATPIGSEIRDPNQKFIYVYDFVKNWGFLVELINVSKEESGKLDEMLLKVADIEERHMRARTKTLISLLAPALIMVVGGMVGFMVIALLLPIFKMSRAMH